MKEVAKFIDDHIQSRHKAQIEAREKERRERLARYREQDAQHPGVSQRRLASCLSAIERDIDCDAGSVRARLRTAKDTRAAAADLQEEIEMATDLLIAAWPTKDIRREVVSVLEQLKQILGGAVLEAGRYKADYMAEVNHAFRKASERLGGDLSKLAVEVQLDRGGKGIPSRKQPWDESRKGFIPLSSAHERYCTGGVAPHLPSLSKQCKPDGAFDYMRKPGKGVRVDEQQFAAWANEKGYTREATRKAEALLVAHKRSPAGLRDRLRKENDVNWQEEYRKSRR
jgi:hypothetical protein